MRGLRAVDGDSEEEQNRSPEWGAYMASLLDSDARVADRKRLAELSHLSVIKVGLATVGMLSITLILALLS